jgi:hypothetical protein
VAAVTAVGASVLSRKNGQRQPEMPTAAATLDERSVLLEELPSSKERRRTFGQLSFVLVVRSLS